MKKMIIAAVLTALAIAMAAPVVLAQTSRLEAAAPAGALRNFPSGPGLVGGYAQGQGGNGPGMTGGQGLAQGQGMYRPGATGGYAQGQSGNGPGMMGGQSQPQGPGRGDYAFDMMGGSETDWMGFYGGLGALILMVIEVGALIAWLAMQKRK